MPNEVRNRIEMADRLQAVMNTTYDELTQELRLKRKHSMLKTYLIESHTSENASSDEVFETVTRAFAESPLRSGRNVTTNRTDDTDLFIVHGVARSEDFIFYLDAADRRFWVAHSISKSRISDVEVSALTSRSSILDSAWMPIELLNSLAPLGESRGLALDFDRRYVDAPVVRRRRAATQSTPPQSDLSKMSLKLADEEVQPVSRGQHLDYVKMQLWGRGADRILDALDRASLKQSTTLSKVRLKTEDSDDSQQFSLADVKFDGKLTGRGSSFGLYSGIVGSVVRKYAEAVRAAEHKFDMHWEQNSYGSKMAGEPLYIKLGEGLTNLERFCSRVFSGAEPFRLLGVPIRRSETMCSVSAVDLHVMQRLDFEITTSTMSVFLPHSTCGNTLLRLYTNLQHYFSSDVKAIDGNGAGVFSFQS